MQELKFNGFLGFILSDMANATLREQDNQDLRMYRIYNVYYSNSHLSEVQVVKMERR
jgi:hypothetical protein